MPHLLSGRHSSRTRELFSSSACPYAYFPVAAKRFRSQVHSKRDAQTKGKMCASYSEATSHKQRSSRHRFRDAKPKRPMGSFPALLGRRDKSATFGRVGIDEPSISGSVTKR